MSLLITISCKRMLSILLHWFFFYISSLSIHNETCISALMAGCLTAVDIDLRNDDLISRYSLTPFYPDQDPEGTNLNLL